ncbi:MAG: DUF3592 domain-containing protein [Oscillospiraceae bacterium]|nr:DUF3592 domain-containing protein [Oscillospiraceae bacterium]
MAEVFGSMDFWLGVIVTVAALVILVKRVVMNSKGKQITATVVEFSEERGTIFPVVEFEYEGTVHRMTTGVGNDKQKVDIGQTMEIRYHPSFKNYVMQVGNKKDLYIGLGALVCGLILVIIPILRFSGINF